MTAITDRYRRLADELSRGVEAVPGPAAVKISFMSAKFTWEVTFADMNVPQG